MMGGQRLRLHCSQCRRATGLAIWSQKEAQVQGQIRVPRQRPRTFAFELSAQEARNTCAREERFIDESYFK